MYLQQHSSPQYANLSIRINSYSELRLLETTPKCDSTGYSLSQQPSTQKTLSKPANSMKYLANSPESEDIYGFSDPGYGLSSD